MTHPIHHSAPLALLKRPRLRRLLAVLNGGGEETRIVGGAVRNALLDRPVTEVDLATTATPAVVDARARGAGLKTVPTGIDHGTVTVIVEGEAFEVTSLREDVETDGRRAVVHFGRDFAVDALRRDFTINALSLDSDGHIHDYTDGVADLAERRVRSSATRIRASAKITCEFCASSGSTRNTPKPIPMPRVSPHRGPSARVSHSCRASASVTNC